MRESRYSLSVERGLAVLGCFTPGRQVLGIGEISEVLGMSPSTTHRYVATLMALRYLEQGAARKYRLSLRVTDLGMSTMGGTGLREHAHAYLEELRTQSSYTVSLVVLDGPDVLYVDRARSFRRGQYKMDLNLGVGSRLPAYCTAVGKLLLAYVPEGDLGRVLGETRMEKRGPHTITNRNVLRDELRQIREDGLAFNDQELAPDHRAIAVPVRAHAREVVAALGMAAHGSVISLEGMVDHLLPHLVATADRISARLGFRREDEMG